MSEKRFNLIDEAWIPIAGHEPVSLKEIFANASLKSLGGNPRQKIAMLKLLLAIAQAAATPETREDWLQLRGQELGTKCLAYLDEWRDKFDLYGDEPFLQMPVKNGTMFTFGAIQPEIATGNNPRLLHSQCEQKLSDGEKALALITEMSMGLGGKIGDPKICLSSTVTKRSAPPAPGMGFMGYLHSFLTGENILDTIWLNLLDMENIQEFKNLPAELGTPPWEKMPETEDCDVAEDLKQSFMGRLVPMARFCLLDGDGLHYTEGIHHPDRNESMWDPSVSAGEGKKLPRMLWADPQKRPWRSLSAQLSFLSTTTDKNSLSCAQLQIGINRLADAKIGKFGIWSGGIKVSTNAGQQYLSGSDDYVESHIQLDYNAINHEDWYPCLNAQMLWLDQLSKILYGCVAGYYRDLKDDSGAEHAAMACGIFWEKTEQLFPQLLSGCQNPEILKETRAQCLRIIENAYNDACPAETARQIANWAEHRPFGRKKEEN